MKSIRNKFIIGLTVLGLGATSFAVQAAQAHPDRQAMHTKWGERAVQRQAKLHDLLKLTPAQESAWGSYVAASKPAARPDHGQRSDWKSMPSPQRMEKRIDMAKQHIAMMESHLAALNSFYGVLTTEQKAVFDANSMGHRGHGRHRSGQHAPA